MKRGLVHEFFWPEDQYILHTTEAQSISLPLACRHGIALRFRNFDSVFGYPLFLFACLSLKASLKSILNN
ncbi:hypothetical protein RHMOL_Rhmol07G0149400 [Rhododendron molle]|uniref:Uncharacterized protein n=1 Tax=Rhododendron molle TaxID=49168 RepID=A0ACC0N2N8_RHOML|nr:hypothetical protein RHMOL_Rhmol07G0149400 [Rhododendron molle]